MDDRKMAFDEYFSVSHVSVSKENKALSSGDRDI
jgi:hypothetical protein